LSFTVFKEDGLRLKLSDYKKWNYVIVLSSVSTMRGTKDKTKTTATTLTKTTFSQINCNVKETL